MALSEQLILTTLHASASLRACRSGRGIPLAAPHAGDLDALEQAGLAERLVAREILGLRPAGDVDDQAASCPLAAVVIEQRPAEHQDVAVLVEIGEMRRSVGRPDRTRAIVPILLVDDVEHAFSSAP